MLLEKKEQMEHFTNPQPKTATELLLDCEFIQLLAGHEVGPREHYASIHENLGRQNVY